MARSFLIIFAVFSFMITSCFAHAQVILQADYDPSIPSIEETIGHKTGDSITTPGEAIIYMNALQAAAPDRMIITPYASSWQGRELITAIITSRENINRLNEIKSDLAKLASGEGLSAAQTSEIVKRTPAVTWLSYGVHGDEISSTDAALALAYHLLAAQNDETVDKILNETIIVIDPMQNPDGRARFVQSFESSLGLEAQSDRYTAEHDQPWPEGRYNHYLFDLNRDWFNVSQPETRGKIKAMMEWNPVVVVDAHEMGGDQTYFFAPAAEPFNPGITKAQREKQTILGRNHAKWFDQFGYEYFTREVFDLFYPGYGDMWPTMNGAIAMTYEQGSTGGLKLERSNGEELTYLDAINHHFIATYSTAEVVANNKDLFLGDYAKYRASAVSQGKSSGSRYFVLDRNERTWTVDQLGSRLLAQGINVSKTEAGKSICGRRYPKGALVVDKAQPNGRLITTLLTKDTPLPQDFIERQEKRRDQGLPHEIFDVTAWSVPLMDGLDVQTCRNVDLSSATKLTGTEVVSTQDTPSGAFGYAVPWTDAGQAKLVLAALSEGLKGKTTDKAFTVNGREFPRGTTIFPNKGNSSALTARLNALAVEIGAEIVPLSDSWVEDGPNFGSGEFHYLKSPKIALAWGDGTVPSLVGATRFVLERKLGAPVSPIRVRTLGSANLDDYDVIILPEAGSRFSDELGEGGAKALISFTKNGGVLVGFGSAVDHLIGDDLKLLTTSRETASLDDEDGAADDGEEDGPVPGLNLTDEASYRDLILDREKKPATVPGVLVNTKANTDHWMSAGYEDAVALLSGSRIYRPLNEADGVNVFRFAAADDLLASGYLWEENRQQLAFKPFVMAEEQGDGIVIAFTQNPTTRAYLNGLTLLVANAVVLGPAHTD